MSTYKIVFEDTILFRKTTVNIDAESVAHAVKIAAEKYPNYKIMTVEKVKNENSLD